MFVFWSFLEQPVDGLGAELACWFLVEMVNQWCQCSGLFKVSFTRLQRLPGQRWAVEAHPLVLGWLKVSRSSSDLLIPAAMFPVCLKQTQTTLSPGRGAARCCRRSVLQGWTLRISTSLTASTSSGVSRVTTGRILEFKYLEKTWMKPWWRSGLKMVRSLLEPHGSSPLQLRRCKKMFFSLQFFFFLWVKLPTKVYYSDNFTF